MPWFHHTSPRHLSNPFHIQPPGCPTCGDYLHPLPLRHGPSACPVCRGRRSK